MLDLGHLTLGNVSDWSSDELGAEPTFSEDDEDDGENIGILHN